MFDFPLSFSSKIDFKKDLNYYVDITHFDLKEFFHLEFDNEGIPFVNYKDLGLKRNYLFVTIWGIYCLQKFLRFNHKKFREKFIKQADWLVQNSKKDYKRGVFWKTDFEWNEEGTVLKPPFVAAMGQGMTISLLIRAYRLTGEMKYLNLVRDTIKLFSLDIKDGGVRTEESGYFFYEEICAYPLVRILDGFLISLIGLHDYYITFKDSVSRKLFEDGIRSLEWKLNYWNYKNCWSWYYPGKKLSCRFYNKFNICLLLILYKITKIEKFKIVAESWMPENKTLSQKIYILYWWMNWRIRKIFRFKK